MSIRLVDDPSRGVGPAERGGARRVRPVARFVLDPEALDVIYPPAIRDEIAALVTFAGPPCTAEEVRRDPSLLTGVEALISGWGGPRLTEAVLASAADLRIVFYGAGSIRAVMPEAAWERGVQVVSAAAANAVPVVEYTVAQITLCLKRVWQHARDLQRTRRWRQGDPGAGGFGSCVGVMSVGEIGRRVIERLAAMDVEICAYDVQPDPDLARRCGVRYVGLDELFTTCDVVTVHTPLLPETRGLVGERLLRQLKPGASLINTARGAIVDESALVRVLSEREDLFAVLDVTNPEPPTAESPLWELPNVVLTPHIAGSRGRECARMGQWMLDEIRRYVAGEPLQWRVSQDRAARLA